MNSYGEKLKRQGEWRRLFPYLYSNREYQDIMNLYEELLKNGTIKHTIADLDDLMCTPEDEGYIEFVIIRYSAFSYLRMIEPTDEVF